jgi:hypothetical protein
MTRITEISLGQFNETFGERLGDTSITTRLQEILGDANLPFEDGELPSSPVLTMSPYLAYPGTGMTQTLSFAREAGINSLVCTYSADLYTSSNPEKADTVRPRLQFAKDQLQRPRIADLQSLNTIGSMKTVYKDLSLAEFYIKLSQFVTGDVPIIDMSDFYLNLTRQQDQDRQTERARASSYYFGLMALSQVCGVGINVGGNEDSGFYQEVVLPNILAASKALCIKPLSLGVSGVPTGTPARKIDVSKLSGLEGLEKELNLTRKE